MAPSEKEAFMRTSELAKRWSYAITCTPPRSAVSAAGFSGAAASNGVSSKTVSNAMRDVSVPRLTCTSMTSIVRTLASVTATAVFM